MQRLRSAPEPHDLVLIDRGRPYAPRSTVVRALSHDAARAAKLECLRGHGAKPKYYHKLIGGNFRLDALQAAIVSAKLPHLDSWTLARQRNAATYDGLFAGSPDVATPATVTDRHVFNQYVIRVADRDRLRTTLQREGVSTEVYYPVPMHVQDCFAYLGHQAGAFLESERAATETLALPVYPEVSRQQIEYVVSAVREFYAGRSAETPVGAGIQASV